MGGRPVWLASLSRRKKKNARDGGRIIPTGHWRPDQVQAARRLLASAALGGVGDAEMERGFRMNVTLCIHRALSDAEIAALPASCQIPAIDLAGGPLEVLWRTARVKDTPSTRPCVSPRKKALPGVDLTQDPELWLPLDCGACEPCRAREALSAA